MCKLEMYFLVNGVWENESYKIDDRIPEKGDIFYFKGNSYRVLDVKEDDDIFNLNIYHVYLD